VVIAVVVVAIIGAVTFAVIDGSDDGDQASPQAKRVNVAEVGQPAPDFELQTFDGKTVRLADLRGKPVLINFWASWCTPCRKEFPFLQALADKNPELEVLGVTEDKIPSEARSFVKSKKAKWPMLNDETGTVAKEYGVRPIPQTMFVDRDGTLTVRVNAPLTLLSKTELDTELAKILAPATAAATPPR